MQNQEEMMFPGTTMLNYLFWMAMGDARGRDDATARIGNISPEIVSVTPLGKDLFQG